MANPVSGVSKLQQAAQVAVHAQSQTAKPAPKAANAAPQDTVKISEAGKAASQAQGPAQTAKSSGNIDHNSHKK